MNALSIEVSALTLYPVKSMKGIAVDEAVLTPFGLQNDRRFMVVRSDGRFVTQRDTPLLALVETRLDDGGVTLSRAGFGQVFVPFDVTDGERIETRVWKDPCETIDQGEVISRWLTEALESGEHLRLVAMAEGFTRPQGKPEQLGADTHTLFADAAPFLVANEASLYRLNKALKTRGHEPVPMNRFRPNIVLRGPDAFAEHRLAGLEGDGYGLRLCHACQRCIVTTIDQDKATRNPAWEPYKTLCELNPVPGSDQKPAFGHNAALVAGEGSRVRIGDTLRPTGQTVRGG